MSANWINLARMSVCVPMSVVGRKQHPFPTKGESWLDVIADHALFRFAFHDMGNCGERWNDILLKTLQVRDEKSFDWLLLPLVNLRFGNDQLRKICSYLYLARDCRGWVVVGREPWTCIAINKACVENVGLFDHRFNSPVQRAEDYLRRVAVVDVGRYVMIDEKLDVFIEAPERTFESRAHSSEKVADLYSRKWGGVPGREAYACPFNDHGGEELDTFPYMALESPTRDCIVVCVPTYHRTRELSRAIESLRAQLHTDFQVWIVKDACKPASREENGVPRQTCALCGECQKTIVYARRICAIDRRFRFFTLAAHAGEGWVARNFAILNSTAAYIAYLDDDNWYEADHLSALLQSLKAGNADFAYTGTTLRKNGKEVGRRLAKGRPRPASIDTSELFHRRELITRFGGWRHRRFGCCDWDIVDRWLKGGARWAHTGKITLNYSVR